MNKLQTENHRLRFEVNALKNLIRRLPETPETSQARELVGLRRWETPVEPSITNEDRKRMYQARRDQFNRFSTTFPINLE